MASDDDAFVWNPGDDNDTLDAQDGFDRMLFNGANVAENISVAAKGGRVRFVRDIANVTIDVDGVEAVNFRALGGADTITVNDLGGTDLTEMNTDLSAVAGGGDGQPDNLIVFGTAGDDVGMVVGDANGVSVLGLAARVNAIGSEVANDRLTMNALAGDDVVEASELAAGAIQLKANGDDGSDILVGSAGDDVLNGGAGDDVIIGGPGIDVIDGGDGDDVEIQLVGSDDAVTSAKTADKVWVADHIRIQDGRRW